jgi:hypothetical protein
MKRKLLFSRVADLLRSRAPGLRDEEQRIDLTTYQLFAPIAVAVGEANGDSP